MTTDHIPAIVHLCFVFAALVGWLTAGATLSDMHPGRAIVIDAFRGCWHALAVAWRSGWRSIDGAAWRQSFRPLVRAIVAALVFACAPAAVAEVVFFGGVGAFSAALCLCLAVGVAAASPCPWFRFVLFGDRRRQQKPFDGADRRAE